MKTLCKKVGKTFDEYKTQSVAFSADSISVCPFCNETPWDRSFDDTHEQVLENVNGSIQRNNDS